MLIIPALIVIVAVAIYTHRNKHRRRCRWRQSKAGSKGALVRYACITCGQEAFRSTGPPRDCLAKISTRGL